MAILTGTDEAKRFGVLVLPYEKRALSISKEIMVDYDDNGHIYVKSKDGKKIFAVTKNLEILIQKILTYGGDNIHVDDPTENGEDGILNEVLKHIYDYINACVQGLSIKDPARVLSEFNIPSLSGIPTEIDGVTDLKDGDSVLLINQTDKRLNGKWIIHTGDWIRSEDLDENTELSKSPFFFISEGEKYKETGWVLSTDNAIVGDSELDWTIFTRQEDLKVGYGIHKEGNEISLEKVTEAGEAFKVKWDEYGNIISGENPTTLEEFGITDGVSTDHIGSGGDQHALVTEDTAGFSSPQDKIIVDTVLPAIENLEIETNNKIDTKSEIEFIDEKEPIKINLEDSFPIADNLNTDSSEVSLSARQGKVIKELIDYLFTNTNEDGNPYMKLWMGTLDQYHSLAERDLYTTLYIATDTIDENTNITIDSSLDELINLIQSIQLNKVSKSGDQMNGPLLIGSSAREQSLKVFGKIYLNGIDIMELFASIDHEHEDMVTMDKLKKLLDQKANKYHEHKIDDVQGLKEELASKSSEDHDHDDRYYTKEETDFKLSTKAAAHHKHKLEDIEDFLETNGLTKYLKDMIQDPLHQTVTAADKERWNNNTISGGTGSGGASNADIMAHNTSPEAHQDIRNEMKLIRDSIGPDEIVKLMKSKSDIVLDTETDSIPIGIDDYDPQIHTLLVFKNSTYQTENLDYKVMYDNTIKILGDKAKIGTKFTFIVLWVEGKVKSIISNSGGTIDGIDGLRQILNRKSDIDHTHKLSDLTSDSEHRTVTDEQIKKWNNGTGSGSSSSDANVEDHNKSSESHSDIREMIKNVEKTITHIGAEYEVIDFSANVDDQTEFTINKSDLTETTYIHFAVIDGMVTNDYQLGSYKIILNEGMKKSSNGHLYLIKIEGNTTTLKDLSLNDLSKELQDIINNKPNIEDVYTKNEAEKEAQTSPATSFFKTSLLFDKTRSRRICH